MLSALIIWLACLLYGWVHSWMASLGLKQQARRLIGPPVFDRYYRLAFNLFSVLTLLPLLALPLLLPDQRLYQIPFPWMLINLTGQGLAVLILIIGILQTGAMEFIGLRQVFDPVEAESSQLVTDGLYRWMRHPLYTAGLTFLWLSPVMSLNLFALYVGLSAYLVIGAHYEERKLLRIYGEAYRAYRQKTPMLIPCPLKRHFKV